MKKVSIDKVAHFLISYALMLTLGLFLPILAAAAITIIGGALKEWYDYTHPLSNTADWYDFWADCLGMACAVPILMLV